MQATIPLPIAVVVARSSLLRPFSLSHLVYTPASIDTIHTGSRLRIKALPCIESLMLLPLPSSLTHAYTRAGTERGKQLNYKRPICRRLRRLIKQPRSLSLAQRVPIYVHTQRETIAERELTARYTPAAISSGRALKNETRGKGSRYRTARRSLASAVYSSNSPLDYQAPFSSSERNARSRAIQPQIRSSLHFQTCGGR